MSLGNLHFGFPRESVGEGAGCLGPRKRRRMGERQSQEQSVWVLLSLRSPFPPLSLGRKDSHPMDSPRGHCLPKVHLCQ